MTNEERHYEEKKAFKKFLENKSRQECLGFMAVLVERIEECDRSELQAQVIFN